ncbi:aspartate/glutamate racemase family protein [Phenylobacterium terrae]|uniref:Aspartate/glutamate racemase family protein n=1 Tax=Phenylobacterium terrae TaxID=2665495 RepID=A0ABW4N9L0_9CAUL
MKTLGLIGGMSAESTVIYYQLLNRLVRERLGGLHSASLVMASLDFAPIARMQADGAWDEAGALLAASARTLEAAGAQAVLICANTMHLVAGAVQAAVSVPLIHIADATADALTAAGARRPLLLATRFTMEKAFYRERLAARGLEALVPEPAERERLHAIIYDELCVGVVSAKSKAAVLSMIAAAQGQGADSVIFGCTEIGLLISQAELDLPAFDTTEIHARAAVDFSLA